MLNRNFVNHTMQEKNEKSIRSLITGVIHMEQSQYKQASQCFDKSITQTENNEIAWFAKACAYQKMGKLDEAKGCLKVAMMQFDEFENDSYYSEMCTMDSFPNKIPQREKPQLNFIV